MSKIRYAKYICNLCGKEAEVMDGQDSGFYEVNLFIGRLQRMFDICATCANIAGYSVLFAIFAVFEMWVNRW